MGTAADSVNAERQWNWRETSEVAPSPPRALATGTDLVSCSRVSGLRNPATRAHEARGSYPPPPRGAVFMCHTH